MGKLVLLRGPTELERLEDELAQVEEDLRRTRAEASAVETNFVEDHLVVTAGAKKGQPLGPKGRKRRLGKLRFLWREEGMLMASRQPLEDRIFELRFKEKAKAAFDEVSPDEGA